MEPCSRRSIRCDCQCNGNTGCPGQRRIISINISSTININISSTITSNVTSNFNFTIT